MKKIAILSVAIVSAMVTAVPSMPPGTPRPNDYNGRLRRVELRLRLQRERARARQRAARHAVVDQARNRHVTRPLFQDDQTPAVARPLFQDGNNDSE